MSNVRAGDLAVVIGGRITPEMINRFVIVERAVTAGEIIDGLKVVETMSGGTWLIRSAVEGCALPLRMLSGELIFVKRRAYADVFMRPIRDNDKQDESFRWAPSPTQKELA